MTAGEWFLMLMAVEYLAAAVVFVIQGNLGYAVVMGAYGVANFGLLWATR